MLRFTDFYPNHSIEIKNTTMVFDEIKLKLIRISYLMNDFVNLNLARSLTIAGQNTYYNTLSLGIRELVKP
ncbi:MAG: hypothetical protein H7096_13070 [Flavobacterium sp.]|nr:hypothetical protein [Pedobacter sp.]